MKHLSLTVDETIHAAFVAACEENGFKQVDVLRSFIASWPSGDLVSTNNKIVPNPALLSKAPTQKEPQRPGPKGRTITTPDGHAIPLNSYEARQLEYRNGVARWTNNQTPLVRAMIKMNRCMPDTIHDLRDEHCNIYETSDLDMEQFTYCLTEEEKKAWIEAGKPDALKMVQRKMRRRQIFKADAPGFEINALKFDLPKCPLQEPLK